MTNSWIDIQQITYLIFIKMLDDNQIKIERKLNSKIAAGIEVNFEDIITHLSKEAIKNDEK